MICRQGEPPRTVDSGDQRQWVDSANLGASVQHLHLGIRREDAHDLHEVAVPEASLRLRARPAAFRVLVEDSALEKCVHDAPPLLGRSASGSPPSQSAQVCRPIAPSCRASASSCWAAMCAAARSAARSARRTPPTTAAAKPPLAGVRHRSGEEQHVPRAPGRRPVRPSRCRKDATVRGAPICSTRSRSPTSMPSSSVEVATMTQSRASANAASDRRRSSSRQRRMGHERLSPAVTQSSTRGAPRSAGSRRRRAASRPGAGGDHRRRVVHASRRSPAPPPADATAAALRSHDRVRRIRRGGPEAR